LHLKKAIYSLAGSPHLEVAMNRGINGIKKTKSDDRMATEPGNRRPKNIDEYIAGVAEPARSTLKQLRATIRSAVPADASETISYGMPAFERDGALVWFAAFANHCSLFPTALVVQRFKEELTGLATSKGTVHFPTGRPLPAGLIRKLVKFRFAKNQSKKKL